MTDDLTKQCVLFFVKLPAAAKVKTRLARDIGQINATELYKSFVADILTALSSFNIPFKICFTPSEAQGSIINRLGEEFLYQPQIGADLAEKMKNAFEIAFADRFERVVLIGSDIPDLPADFIHQAFTALDSHDAVIGPSSDGGYYLIGFSKDTFLPGVFENITWSSPSVLEQTLGILNQSGRKLYTLPQWHDVDDLTGLIRLVKRSENTAFQKSKTMAFILDELPWILADTKPTGGTCNV